MKETLLKLLGIFIALLIYGSYVIGGLIMLFWIYHHIKGTYGVLESFLVWEVAPYTGGAFILGMILVTIRDRIDS
jgi:hypothetical protein